MAIQRQEPAEALVRVELYRRSYVPETFEERIEDIVTRLEGLVAGGAVDGFRVHDWNKSVRVSVAPQSEAEPVACVERYREFAAWADEAGVELTPFFDEERLGRYDVITFPILCLAVYESDDLVALAPYRVDDETWTVPEYLDAIEAGEDWALHDR